MGYESHIDNSTGCRHTPPDPTAEELLADMEDERQDKVKLLMKQYEILGDMIEAGLWHNAGQQACRVAAASFDCEEA